jgi:hypothetical protein
MKLKPLCIDLYCGLGGWAEGFLAEGYRVVGFDIERHDYGTGGYPAELVLQDVLALDGADLADAAVIVASPPCQEFAYRMQPWKMARAQKPENPPAWWYKISRDMSPGEMQEWKEWQTTHPIPPPDTSLFEACFRIQREASEAAGRHVPLIVENVRGAQKWVGYAKWHFGSYFLWGDIPALMPIARSQKVYGQNFSRFSETGQTSPHWRLEGLKQAKRLYLRDGHSHTRHLANPAEHLAIDGAGIKLASPGHFTKPGSGLDWFDRGAALFGSDSMKRKAASAMLAKIPFPLARHIAQVFKADSHEQARAVGPGPIPSTLNPESEGRDPKTLSVSPIPQGNSTEEP